MTGPARPFRKRTLLRNPILWTRRWLLLHAGAAGLIGLLFGGTRAVRAAAAAAETGPGVLADAVGAFFQKQYKRMSAEEVQAAVERIARNAKRQFDTDIEVRTDPPKPNTVYGYAINLSKCKGYRKCVDACVEENNQSRDPAMQYIRVLEMNLGSLDLSQGDHYYDAELVPREGKFYLPMQCVQCDNPPCVKSCPVEATWKEPDGIVVTDYDWCIGCRACVVACPYHARRFNWDEPSIPASELNPRTHFLGNRPRHKGVVEKCTDCLQRVRRDRQPACMEACPTGARIFGNLLDPHSEIRYALENKNVFRLKEEAGCEPKFWYFFD